MLTDAKNIVTIKLPDELSRRNVEAFQGRLDSALRDAPSEIIIDCASLIHVTSKDIAMLWQAHEQCAASGVTIRLVSMSQFLVRVLKTLDLYEYFKRDEDQERLALTAIVQPPDCAGAETMVNLFAACEEGIETFLSAFLGYLGRLALPELKELELRTIFYEIATNICAHSGLDENSPVAFSASSRNGTMTLTFADMGLEFDPTAHKHAHNMREAANARRTHGFGITMFHRLADSVRYERRDGCVNVLIVEKRWGV
ncbi:MAG: ATP-binding protein [candidate division Zixibacteria bacterium]|nr:ATP-binding protein [candidate division Zixibacteria bacterium]